MRRLLGQQRSSVEFYRKSQAWNSTASFSDVDEKNRKGGDAEDDFTHSRPDHVFRGVHRVFDEIYTLCEYTLCFLRQEL